MASKMRKVRRLLRHRLRSRLKEGNCSRSEMESIVESIMAHEVGYATLVSTFLRSELNMALAYLQRGPTAEAESNGMVWKHVDNLDDMDLDVISVRILKRMRGEASRHADISDKHGRHSDASFARGFMDQLERLIEARESAIADEHAESEMDRMRKQAKREIVEFA